MVQDPLEKIEAFIATGANILTVHVESCIHIHRVLQRMGSLAAEKVGRSFLRGIALNPGTPIDALRPLLAEVDYILLLAVNPGWPGQKFLPSTARRLTNIRELIAETGRDILVGVDGGISRENIGDVAAMKPDIIVIGSAIFDGGDAAKNLRFMMEAVSSARMKADEKSLVG
jgi:ribulose-phosphate 3-epimerase